jgi:phosphatidylglycerol---prolipoprotein diacylglyceryl transferase
VYDEPTHWVHDLNPVLISFSENFGIRYYGLSYALAFIIGMLLLALYRKKGRSGLTSDQEMSLIWAGALGVFIGGRLGYMLLYQLREFSQEPWILFKVWEGGMASHGGFLGVLIAVWWFCRKEKLAFLPISDMMCTLVPQGLMLGRIANFINGELWGKVSDVSWAVIFPLSGDGEVLVSEIPARHPSQLYEAALEGLLLLVYCQFRFWKTDVVKTNPGRLSGEFLVLYAIVRVFGEFFREPDASLILGMSRGIFYSVFIAVGGAGLIYFTFKSPKKALN